MIFRISTPFRAFFAGFRVLLAKLWGFRVLTTFEEQKERLNVCEPCEELTEERQCRVCTCFVDEKTLLTTEMCPLKKWWPIYRRQNTIES